MLGEKMQHVLPYVHLFVLPAKLVVLTIVSLIKAWQVSWKNTVLSLAYVPNNFLILMLLNVLGKFVWDIYSFRTRKCGRFQEKVLLDIVKENSQTEYGHKYGFEGIDSIQDFQKKVPVITYADMLPYVERMSFGEQGLLCATKPVFYTTTSGTTATPKYLPITRESLKKGHRLTQLLWMHHFCKYFPFTLSGKFLVMVSPAIEGHMPDGTPYGSATGLISKKIPGFLKKKYVLPACIAEIQDYSARYYCILRCALEHDDISYITTANPSTILLLCQKMQEWAHSLIQDIRYGILRPDVHIDEEHRIELEKMFSPNRDRAIKLTEIMRTYGKLTPHHVWPGVKSVGCWTGGNAATFLNSLKKYFPENTNFREVGYIASELKGSIPIRKQSPAGILALADNFFEFVEMQDWENCSDWKNARFLLAHELEVGQKYYIFITNNNGLYRYDINDIVQVVGFHGTTPEILFLQKGKGVTNITGEKLYETQVVTAVEEVKQELDLDLYFYLYIANIQANRYELLAEFNHSYTKEELDIFTICVDEKLQAINSEYAAKRHSLRLGQIRLREIVPGGFNAYKYQKIQEGQREGQFKLVILSDDMSLLEQFPLIDHVHPVHARKLVQCA